MQYGVSVYVRAATDAHATVQCIQPSVFGFHVFGVVLRIPTIWVKRARVWAMRCGVYHGRCDWRFLWAVVVDFVLQSQKVFGSEAWKPARYGLSVRVRTSDAHHIGLVRQAWQVRQRDYDPQTYATCIASRVVKAIPKL